MLVALAQALEPVCRSTLSRWLLAAWLCQLTAITLGTPPWLALGCLLLATAALALPELRRQWWPRSRRGVYVLAVALALAVVLAAVSSIAARGAKRYEVSLGQGESTRLRDAFGREWTLAQQGVSAFRAQNREVIAVTIEAVRGGQARMLLVSERRQAVDSRGEEIAEPVVVTGRKRGLVQEIAVRLERPLPNDAAALRVDFRPLKSGLSAAYVLLVATGLGLWMSVVRRHA